MSRHDPPLPNEPEGRLMRRLAELERKINSIEQQPGLVLAGSKGGFGIQKGSLTLTPTGGSFAGIEVALATPWTHEHLAFLPMINPTAANNAYLTNFGPFNGATEPSLGHGYVAVAAGTTQNVTVYWVSIGR